jgi:hypothetical protein
MLRRLAALPVLLALSAPALAFTPESGFYFTASQGGTGQAIEIQDDFVFLAGYVYDTQGRATWVTAQGRLTGNDLFQNATLDTFTGGQCIGCPYTPPTQGPSAGTIRIEWTTETVATLTWNGQTKTIERFNYALGDTTSMLEGEWQVVLDWFELDGVDPEYPFFGDILIFDSVDRAPNPDLALGCRPQDSTVGSCDATARADHDTAGFFNAGTSEHVLVVKDTPGSSTTDSVYFAYFVDMGLTQFDGVMEIYDESEDPGDGPYYPVRGFRSASRNFVKGGTGPSAADPKAARTARSGMAAKLTARPGGMTVEQVKARYGFDPRTLAPAARQLIDHLASDDTAR